MFPPYFYTQHVLGWPKSLFKFSVTFYGKTQRNFYDQPNSKLVISILVSRRSLCLGWFKTEAQVHPGWRPTTPHAGDQFYVYRGHHLSRPWCRQAGAPRMSRDPWAPGLAPFQTGRAETAGWSSGTARFPGSHLHSIWRAPRLLEWEGDCRVRRACLAGKSNTACYLRLDTSEQSSLGPEHQVCTRYFAFKASKHQGNYFQWSSVMCLFSLHLPNQQMNG